MSRFNNLLPNGEGTLSADSVHQAREALKRQVAGERINIYPDIVIQGATSGATARLSEVNFLMQFASYLDYVPGETATPPSGCCRSCGCKKELTNGLCLKCAEVEKLMGECFDKTGKVDLSGHVGQRDEMTPHYFQDDPPWPTETAADEYRGYLVVPFTNPLPGLTIRSTELTTEYQGADGQGYPLSELDNDPFCFQDYIFPFPTLRSLGLLQRALNCRTFTFARKQYTVRDIDFDDQIVIATRNS